MVSCFSWLLAPLCNDLRLSCSGQLKIQAAFLKDGQLYLSKASNNISDCYTLIQKYEKSILSIQLQEYAIYACVSSCVTEIRVLVEFYFFSNPGSCEFLFFVEIRVLVKLYILQKKKFHMSNLTVYKQTTEDDFIYIQSSNASILKVFKI